MSKEHLKTKVACTDAQTNKGGISERTSIPILVSQSETSTVQDTTKSGSPKTSPWQPSSSDSMPSPYTTLKALLTPCPVK